MVITNQGVRIVFENNQTCYTPQEELFTRIERLQGHLLTAGMQAALIVQNADLFYFSGTCQDAHLLIPARGEPLLMVRKNYERALEESALDKIIAVQSYKDIGRSIAGSLKNRGGIGLELDVLPANLFFRYKKMLEPLEIIDVSGAIREIRMIKSPYEIECMKECIRVTSEMYNEVPNLLKEGMTEIELSSRLELLMRVKGNQGNPRLRAFNQEAPPHVLSGRNSAYPSFFDGPTGGAGLSPAFPQGPGFKTIGRNEPILVDFSAVINGYVVDHTRIFSIGPLSDKLVEAHNTALEIKRRFIQEIKPGANGKDFYDMAVNMAEKAGLSSHFMGSGVHFVGHGLGLELDELPVIAKNHHVTLQSGMVLALEPKFVFPGEGTVGVEDTFVLTESGLEQLNMLDDSIKIL
ncbi:Xaa-Pro dipeptidase [Pelotomaculum schinkii]|uniref:Xaa-Pro dipeptidase n=1 Tax=Pelotomaculum schinkii TaxID=78350 RepID=A0A4Y7RG75_9FIRM|nr:Xaa-Pro peptidase family protein [Pelotomaculum schinkii]TEB07783.1 Xaa-Pro dipeptidase [Pelotomaculum schinkii]